ncbi:hypothetical protein EMPS_04465 [Entomortierella parvispora]|uniref:Uncharacterized protein n=1 Tax=Entomortierella parvispora TaxID=205924 RepID=A0A9P3H981_9FUNG|nr:hypothetical protein EMPS_04465 [Entomortierella parvispora]
MHIRIRKIPSITIFHDPTLTASKHALKILKHVSNLKKYNVDLIQDKKNPPEPEIIARIVHLLAPGDIPTGCKLILTEDAPKASTVEEVQAILARNPLLFKKPLLVDWAQGKAIIGEVSALSLTTLSFISDCTLQFLNIDTLLRKLIKSTASFRVVFCLWTIL